MPFPPEFCYHTIGNASEEWSSLISFQKEERQKEEVLIKQANGAISTVLKTCGPIKIGNLVSSINEFLGYGEGTYVLQGIRAAVWDSLCSGVLSMTSDYTVSLNKRRIHHKK